MRKGIVYKYTFPDGKVYIGQTRRHPEVRKREHIDQKIGPLNSGFWRAYQQFGTYQYDVLFECESENDSELVAILNEKETEFIAQYKATNSDYGYNKMQRGSVSVSVWKKLNQKLEALAQEIYAQKKPFVEAILSKAISHQPLTDDEKDILLGLQMAGETEKLIRHNEGVEIIKNEFFLDEFSEWILFVLKEDCESFAAEYLHENMASIIQEVCDKDVILQLDKEDGHVIREFYSLGEIVSEFGLERDANVWNVLRGKQKTAYGYKWAYKHPENHK